METKQEIQVIENKNEIMSNLILNGDLSKMTPTECEECDGTGKIWFSCCGDELNKGDFEGDDVSCPTCKEHCSIDDYEKCEACNGTGEVKND